jgi:membrane protease YdiL (CAAX protease family)
MIRFLQKLSPTIELSIVLTVGFGFLIYQSTKLMLNINSDYSNYWIYNLSTRSLLAGLVYELITLLIITFLLRTRNWSLKDFNIQFLPRFVGVGILLLFASNIISGIIFKLLELLKVFEEQTRNSIHFNLNSNWVLIIVFIILNSIFEEALLIGYLFKRLAKLHPVIIIILSVFIREIYHTYQGWTSAIIIIPLGIVFGYYYYKYRKLWPLIIAHSIRNIITFLSFQFHWYEKFHHYLNS